MHTAVQWQIAVSANNVERRYKPKRDLQSALNERSIYYAVSYLLWFVFDVPWSLSNMSVYLRQMS